MTNINITIIHPMNNCEMEIWVPESLSIEDIFEELVDAKFLTDNGLHGYVFLKPTEEGNKRAFFDNSKTLPMNGISDRAILQITMFLYTSF